MTQTPFEEVWRRIVEHQGQPFRTGTGLEFTYRVRGSTFYPSRTEYAINRTDFETAYQMVPLQGPGSISKAVRGPSYVWAVLHDTRISQGEW
jgi:hypothetical protein